MKAEMVGDFITIQIAGFTNFESRSSEFISTN